MIFMRVRRFIALAVVLLLELAAAAAAAADPGLSEGLTIAWYTPIYRGRLEDEDSPKLKLVADAILAQFESFNASEQHPERAITASDAFFYAQSRGYRNGGRHLLASMDGEAGSILREWHGRWQQAIVRYVETAGGPRAAQELQRRQKKLGLFAWAAVHRGCSQHEGHFHDKAAVSGVFYLRTSAQGGAFFAEDPRGPRFPFDGNVIRHAPRAGDLLLFPPWMRHGVDPTGQSCGERRRPQAKGKGADPARGEEAVEGAGSEAPRIAISFNLGAAPVQRRGAAACQAECAARQGDEEEEVDDDDDDDWSELWQVLSDTSIAREMP